MVVRQRVSNSLAPISWYEAICVVGTERVLEGKSLYDSLGGRFSISWVVDKFMANVAADTRITGRFAITDIRTLKGHLVDQVCIAAGGICTYSGRDMRRPMPG